MPSIDVVPTVEPRPGTGTSYRFASSDPGAGIFYGRVILSFCRFIAGGIARYASMASAIEEAATQ